MTNASAGSALSCSTIPQIVKRNSELYGDRIAFRDENSALSFAEFHHRAASLQQALKARGSVKGDRIALLSRNRIEYMETCAATGEGCIVATLNWRLSYQELRKLLDDCRPKVIIAETELFDKEPWPDKPFADIPIKISLDKPLADWELYEEALASATNPSVPSETIEASDPACIVYTSGTSGTPKGVIHTHGGLIGNAQNIAIEMLKLTDKDVTIAMMPLFHVGGMWYHTFPSYAAGAETILRSKFSPGVAIDLIIEHEATNIHLVPTMVADIIASDVKSAGSFLKTLFYAASPMPVQILKQAMATFPDCDFVQSYGSTESGTVAFLRPEDHVQAIDQPVTAGRLESCGRPFSGVEVALRDENNIKVDSGNIGEVFVLSNKTMCKYWDNAKATNDIFDDNGWLATGDLGRFDEDGYLYLVDRKGDMIITGGENVYPGEVEQVLYEMDGIAAASVLGMPDQRFVEKVVACIVPRPDASLTQDDVIAFAKARLAGYKCPKDVVFMDSLPRSGAGKILKRALREKLEAKT